MALGPVLATPAVLLLGMPGTLLLFIPAAVMSAVLFWDLPRLIGFRTASEGGYEEAAEHSSGEREAWRPFAVMVGVVTLRSVVYFGLILLVAQYYASVLDAPVSVGNAALSVMLFAGAAGTLLAGPLADRFGRRTVLAASMIVLGPLLLAFSFSGVVAGFVLIAFIGAAIIGTFGTTVVMGQEYLPGRIGLAAGITMGFSIGLGGVGSPMVGAIADGLGVRTALLAMAALPVIGLVLTLTLPRGKHRAS